MTSAGLTPKKAGFQSTMSASLPGSSEPDLVGDAVADGGVDGVLGDVALDALVVRVLAVTGEGAALHLHLVRRLPGPQDDLADAAHGLRIRGDHADGAEVVEDVLGGDGLAPDARLGEGHVLGHARVEVVADHEHVEVLGDRVHRVRPGRVRRGGQDVGLAHGPDDVRRVAAAGALGVVGVDGAALEGRQGLLHEARLVERVGVDGDLDVEAVRHRQAGVDGGRRRAPVLVQLQADGASPHLLLERDRQAGVALAQEAEVDRQRIRGLEHARQVPRARACRSSRSCRSPGRCRRPASS